MTPEELVAESKMVQQEAGGEVTVRAALFVAAAQQIEELQQDLDEALRLLCVENNEKLTLRAQRDAALAKLTEREEAARWLYERAMPSVRSTAFANWQWLDEEDGACSSD